MPRLNSSSRPEMGRTGSLLSELSVEKDPRNFQEHEETSTLLESQETESKSTEWTDEKHSFYLKSMETSFVNQLYQSLDTLGASQQEYSSEPKTSRQKNNGVTTPSGQFKVFKDGSWARVNFNNFRRDILPQWKKADKTDPILENPWIQHYRSSCKRQTRLSPTLQEQTPVSTILDPSAFQFGCQDSVCSNAEVTDQNFVDEVSEEEKSSRKRRHKCRRKSAAASLSNDQVVPFTKLSLMDDLADIHASRKE